MIKIKTEKEIEIMRYSGIVNNDTHKLVASKIKAGISTKELDEIAYNYIKSKDCKPSFFNFEGYPANICTSINEEIVHGIPGSRILEDGDIISIDIGVNYKGLHTDAARSYSVGSVNKEVKDLLKNTKKSLNEGIKVIKDGVKLNEVCMAIEKVALENNYGVFKELTGHGVGRNLHEDPYIPNYSNEESKSITLKSGMTIAIEPMFSLKGSKLWLLENNWTIAAQDNSPVAHFEDTILITKNGYEILTGER